MMRNMGGSIGIATLATLVTQREQFHSNRLGESVSLYNPATAESNFCILARSFWPSVPTGLLCG